MARALAAPAPYRKPLRGARGAAITHPMSENDTPQLYLITPPAFALESFADTLAKVLDAQPVACVRLALAAEADEIARAADGLRGVAHARDVPLVIDSHVGLVEKLGLDGVHLMDSSRSVRKTRKELGADPIVGAYCGASQDAGLAAGEAGADYVAFGPVGETGLGSGEIAPQDLFAWWSQMIELPVVAEGGLSRELIEALAPVTDFFALGPELWGADDPVAALSDLTAPLR